MIFDRFDILEAHYVFAMQFHGGQGSELYARLSRISRFFKPRQSLNSHIDLSDNGLEIFENLLIRYNFEKPSND